LPPKADAYRLVLFPFHSPLPLSAISGPAHTTSLLLGAGNAMAFGLIWFWPKESMIPNRKIG
jgi:hypothetical protein